MDSGVERIGQLTRWTRSNLVVLVVVGLYAIAGIFFTINDRQERVGDAGEYVAMSWQLSNLDPPSLTPDDVVAFREHAAGIRNAMPDYAGFAPKPELESGGRFDFAHFWSYPLLTVPFEWVARAADWPDTYAFAAVNILIACLAMALTLRKLGLGPAILLFVSPLIWWLDKPHTEVVVFSLVLVALLLWRTRPVVGIVCMAFLMSMNLGFAVPAVVYGASALLDRRSHLFDGALNRVLLVGAAVIAAAHPAYYLVRLGRIDPQSLLGTASVRLTGVSRFLDPLLDPYIGLVSWWPFLLLVAGVGGFLRAWRRVPQKRTIAQWAVTWSPFILAMAVLFGQSQNIEPASGGNFGLSRYAMWLAPFAIYGMGRTVFRTALQRVFFTVVTAASVAMSLNVARMSRPDFWYTTRPNRVATFVFDHAPWIWNPPPQVFMGIESGQLKGPKAPKIPMANVACTKLLAVDGVWPQSCPAPQDVPEDCVESSFCYANRWGRGWQFAPTNEFG